MDVKSLRFLPTPITVPNRVSDRQRNRHPNHLTPDSPHICRFVMKRTVPRMPIDPYFLFGLIAVVIAGGAYRYRGGGAPLPSSLSHIPASVTRSYDSLGVSHSLGVTNAPIQVIELSDYQCPACAVAHRTTWPAIERHVAAGTVRFTTYDLPLPSHANAIPAAVVVGCVAHHDEKAFWELRHEVFARQDIWADSYPAEQPLLQIASSSGIDTAAVRSCMQSRASHHAAQLRRSWEVARAAGINYTPVWAINGRVVSWATLEQEIEKTVRESGR